MEPITLTLGVAVVAGASGKFAEMAAQSGGKWLSSYFKDHQPTAQKKAAENTMAFLGDLAHRLSIVEKENEKVKQKIQTAQDHPAFSSFLQKAVLAASETDNNVFHQYITRMVYERLMSADDSVFSLVSKRAIESISYLSSNQIKLLALLADSYIITPRPCPPNNVNPIEYPKWADNYIVNLLNSYNDLRIGKHDLSQLESLSCIKSMSPKTVAFSHYNSPPFRYSFNSYETVPGTQEILDGPRYIFKRHIQGLLDKISLFGLSSVGLMIGTIASDQLTGSMTSFEDWD